MKELEEDLKQLDQQIMFKEKRRDQAESVRNYKLCDELTEEVGKLKATRREASNELKLFQKKVKQARWYQEKRRRSSDGSAEKPRKPGGSGGVFSDSDTPLESPSSVATDATILLSDSGSEMELGHFTSTLASASSASTDEIVVDMDHRDAASLSSSPCATATTPSSPQSLRCSAPTTLFPVPKVKSSSVHRRRSSSSISSTSAPSHSSSFDNFSPH